jgi:hypothetical protein
MRVEVAARRHTEVGFRADVEVKIFDIRRPAGAERVLNTAAADVAEMILRIAETGYAAKISRPREVVTDGGRSKPAVCSMPLVYGSTHQARSYRSCAGGAISGAGGVMGPAPVDMPLPVVSGRAAGAVPATWASWPTPVAHTIKPAMINSATRPPIQAPAP